MQATNINKTISENHTCHVFKIGRDYYHCKLKMFHGRWKYLNLNFNNSQGQIQGRRNQKYKQIRLQEPEQNAYNKLRTEGENNLVIVEVSQ